MYAIKKYLRRVFTQFLLSKILIDIYKLGIRLTTYEVSARSLRRVIGRKKCWHHRELQNENGVFVLLSLLAFNV